MTTLDSIRQLFDFLKRQDRHVLTEPESKKILASVGIPITKEAMARDVDETQEFAMEIGLPVVLKIVSPQVLHKSDSGGVKTNLQSIESIRQAYFEIVENVKKLNPSSDIEGVLVQEMLPPAIETILGVTNDDQLGPVMMFGLGGIFVEILQDVTYRIIPVNKDIVIEMLGEIKGKKIFSGFRSFPAIEEDCLADVIIKLSDFSFEFKDYIQEIDINPLHCNGNKIKAMDALIILKRN